MDSAPGHGPHPTADIHRQYLYKVQNRVANRDVGACLANKILGKIEQEFHSHRNIIQPMDDI
ncbi:hypothetical protein D3C81_2285970 [compost metagenome]